MILPDVDNDVQIYQAAAFDKTYRYKKDGIAQNISGAAIVAKFRTAIESPDVVIERTVGDGITITNAADGQFKVSMTAEETAEIDFPEQQELYFDVLLTLAGQTHKIVYGTATYYQTVSREDES